MNANHHAVLHALFVMAQSDRHATVLRVARETGLAKGEVEHALTALDRAGLVHADRVRLSMQGLGVAVMMGRPSMPRRPAASMHRAA